LVFFFDLFLLLLLLLLFNDCYRSWHSLNYLQL
jgi:hypothetical protein